MTNEMETFLAKVALNFLGTDVDKTNKEYALSKTLVKLCHELSSINIVALSNWRKPLTEAKKEDIGRRLSSFLYYCGVLIHLLDISPEGFSNDALTQYADEFDENYHQDGVLCSMNGISAVVDMVEGLFNIPMLEPGEEPGEPADCTDEIAELLATSFILAARFDLDIEALMFNALLIDKF